MLSAIDKQLASVSSLRLISERSLMRQMLVVGWGFGLLLAVADFTFFAPFNWGDAITLPVASIAIVVSLITPVDRYASSWYVPAIWLGVFTVVVQSIADHNSMTALYLFLPAVIVAILFARQPLAKWLVLGPIVLIFIAVHIAVGGRQNLITAFALAPLLLAVSTVAGMLFARVRSSAEEQLRMQGTATALLMALEARDGYTADHSNEVLDIVDGVARRLGMNEAQRRVATYVALLHDIGKIGIPNEILHKPGKLTDEEWIVMKQHPAIGERILRELPGFEPVARAVRHEHERWDGNGYPDQLSGEQIPIYSRIVLVCDAYHAMTSDRPYREAMGESYARTELLRYAGTQFDPDVVDCLLQELEERQIAAHDDRVVAAQHLQSAYDRALARTVGPLDNNQNVSAVVHDEGTFTETPVSL